MHRKLGLWGVLLFVCLRGCFVVVFCCLFVLCIFWLVGGWLGGQGWGLGVGVSPIEEAAHFCAGNPHCSDIHFCSDSLCATMNTRKLLLPTFFLNKDVYLL